MSRTSEVVPFAFFLLSLHIGKIQAQQLHRWQSKDGHATEAAFYAFDEEKGTVTILLPKVVPLDKLHSDSIELAKRLSGQSDLKGNDAKAPMRVANTENSKKSFKPTIAIDYEPFDIKKWQAKSIRGLARSRGVPPNRVNVNDGALAHREASCRSPSEARNPRYLGKDDLSG